MAFTANGWYLSIVVARNFFTVNFFYDYRLKFVIFTPHGKIFEAFYG